MTKRMKERREAEYPRPEPIMKGMTLKEAIKIIQYYQVDGEALCGGFLDDALKLIIEAGKRIQHKRLDHWVLITPLLPGETEE